MGLLLEGPVTFTGAALEPVAAGDLDLAVAAFDTAKPSEFAHGHGDARPADAKEDRQGFMANIQGWISRAISGHQ